MAEAPLSLPLPDTLDHYREFDRYLDELRLEDESKWKKTVRLYGEADLYFLTRYVLSSGAWIDKVSGRRGVDDQWVLDRAMEVADNWHNILDIWSRGHWKSTLKTFALPIQLVLRDPETAIGITSIQKSLAVKHTSKIRSEFENNPILAACWPDIMWPRGKPNRGANRKWSQDEFEVQRKGNRIEATITACGIMEGLPIGSHFDIRIDDDLVSEDVARTRGQREKIDEQWKSAQNLTSRGSLYTASGTYYHFDDLHSRVVKQGITPRVRPGIDREAPPPGGSAVIEVEGKKVEVGFREIGGKPLYLTAREYAEKLLRMGPKVFGNQILCDPMAGQKSTLDESLLRTYKSPPMRERDRKNVYLLADFGGSRLVQGEFRADGQDHDPSAIEAWGLGDDLNFYLLDAVYDWLEPHERIRCLIDMHRRWRPIDVRIEYTPGSEYLEGNLKSTQESEGYRFVPTWVTPPRTSSKEDKINSWLQPLLRSGRIYLPEVLRFQRKDGTIINITELFRQQVREFPIAENDDLIDCPTLLAERSHQDGSSMTRPLVWPRPQHPMDKALDRVDRYGMVPRSGSPSAAWMANL